MMKLLALHKRNSHKSHEVTETSVELDGALHEIVYEKIPCLEVSFLSSQQTKNRSKFKYPSIKKPYFDIWTNFLCTEMTKKRDFRARYFFNRA